MAEAIGLASGLLTLAVYALKSGSALYEIVQSFRDHPKRVRDLIEEIKALIDVLGPLVERLQSTPDTDLLALKHPLLRCGAACKGLEEEILKRFSRTLDGRTSIRDWAKLKYISYDINEVMLLFSGYRMTIVVALTDANLRKSTATAESIENWKQLLTATTNDLKDRLELIDEKVQLIVEKSVPESSPEISELKNMREERLSTQNCLKICAQLAEHIGQIQLATQSRDLSIAPSDLSSASQKITSESFQECKKSHAAAVVKLEKHALDLVNDIMRNTTTENSSEDNIADFAKLREEWESTREFIEICSAANKHLKEDITVLNNSGPGDAIQVVVSTEGKVIQGNNQGTGWRAWQVGGHFDNESFQQISRDLFGRRFHDGVIEGASTSPTIAPPLSDDRPKGATSEVRNHWGRVHTLTTKPPSNT
ncbi:hypothetical protein MMC13_004871 [Lambiella insularis]|nr:hypothetical protein [Lambiella insularis]